MARGSEMCDGSRIGTRSPAGRYKNQRRNERSSYVTLRDEFRENGVVFIERALDPASMQMAEDAYKWSLAHPSPGSANFVTKDSPATFYQDLANPKALDPYRQMLETSPAADIAAALWGTPDVWFMYEQVFLKEGGESRRTPWHQDSSYLPIEGQDIAVVWISFEPVAKEKSLEFVRGSHRGPLYDGSSFDPNDDTAPLYGNGVLPRLPNIEAERAKWDIVSWAVQPGDVVVFHPAMLHGGAPTHGSIRRRTLSLRFFGDDSIYKLRPTDVEATTPPFRREPGKEDTRSALAKIGETLKPGDPFRHPEFLKLRPRH
jgi:ectoine hydroxylase-related dioxygenase (phytanoyl-CoA dioxygenase family)